MIILDDSEDPFSDPDKLIADSRSVHRPATPTPSLPSYEISQSQAQGVQCPPEELEAQTHRQEPDQQQPEKAARKWWPKNAHRRFRRALLYALVVYFVITVAVGVPIIVVKLRHRASEHSPFPPKGGSSSSLSLISDSATTLPKSLAVGCNAWTEHTPSSSTLQYNVHLNSLVFLQSNVSYQSDPSTLQDISGTLSVGINADPYARDGIVSVAMYYSSQSLKDQTSVCLMNVSNSSGLYLYVPSNLSASDSLSFNVTFLFPQAQPLYISEFVTMLPHFAQYFESLSDWVSFDKVTLGGPQSLVSVASIDATSLEVKTALAGIQGNFNVTESLVLETVSAPIDVNISLHNSGHAEPTFLDVSTGNAPLNASVCLFLPQDADSSRMPNFITRFETFNAPLTVFVDHAPGSAAGVLRLRAESSVGQALVAVDSAYTGVFDVSTTFATADVFSSNVNSVAQLAQVDVSYLDGDVVSTSTGTTNADVEMGRTLIFDTMQSSRLTGWVGVPPRPSVPPTPKYFGRQGGIEVISTLSPAALLFGT
ncbi:uncharacterized protein C8Q71DRAFT_777702 [Rhodofomes roseus]|uniref:Transmembrane protein n=1 Tax=Rhodofomes roseus TaxID=34475 RepID=A0ABQ8K5E7_9APHY|nr:uncharacterized protein C8Q71DRAFT_777702 [Rhodofomes roseus]KAH9832174.1 hypothetical protein C8Q71DRAFT_777702 [Rhodofomes roseus]